LPDRLYLVGRDGRIAYRGAPGPFGFIATELGRILPVTQVDFPFVALF